MITASVLKGLIGKEKRSVNSASFINNHFGYLENNKLLLSQCSFMESVNFPELSSQKYNNSKKINIEAERIISKRPFFENMLKI